MGLRHHIYLLCPSILDTAEGEREKKRTDMMSAGVYEKDEDGDTRPPGYYAISITY
jgi:hypothetical protein